MDTRERQIHYGHLRTALLLLGGMICGGNANAEVGPVMPHAVSVSLGGSRGHDAFHGDIMVESDVTETVTGRVGLSFFLSDNDGIFGGIEGGREAALPGTIAPFVGAGLFLGQWTEYEPAANDGIDNDDDSQVDEYGEEKEVADHFVAIYPEVGLHLWLGESVRLGASARHFVTTKGRGSDRTIYSTEFTYHFR